MNTPFTHRYVLRAVIEFTTPFLIGAGREGDVADVVFVADANGLPAIPGSSLAGVLRAAYRESGGDADRLFGFQRAKEGAGSRLAVSWGCLHDSADMPVEGLQSPKRLDDPVLAKAMSPVIRDHVRINHRGASDAEERGKFDEQAVCAGHRFTFELEMVGSQEDKTLWKDLLDVLACPTLRLGGKTRRGYGAFCFVSLKNKIFDLQSDFEVYRRHPVSLAEPSPMLSDLPPSPPSESNAETVEIRLSPSGYWMFGGGYDLPGDAGEADMAPVRDCRIVWSGDRGRVVENVLVIPAAGVKGALSHRVAFHYNALTGRFAGSQDAQDPHAVTGENNRAVRQLFGYCKESPPNKGKRRDESETDGAGQRGRVILDDLYLEDDAAPDSQLVHHVGIDRFTGGARDQVLFCERPRWKGELPKLFLRIQDPGGLDAEVLQALKRAVEDLAAGRLQIGAGSGRGLGYFTGVCAWPESLNK